MVERHVGGNWGHMSWNVYGSHLMITPFPRIFGLRTFSTSILGGKGQFIYNTCLCITMYCFMNFWVNKWIEEMNLTRCQMTIEENLQHFFTCMDWLTFWLKMSGSFTFARDIKGLLWTIRKISETFHIYHLERLASLRSFSIVRIIPDICHRYHRRCLWRKNLSCGEISPHDRLSLENFST